MNEHDVRRLALVFAIQAQIEGMKAANKERLSLGGSIAYRNADFCNKADELENLAHAHNDQL